MNELKYRRKKLNSSYSNTQQLLPSKKPTSYCVLVLVRLGGDKSFPQAN